MKKYYFRLFLLMLSMTVLSCKKSITKGTVETVEQAILSPNDILTKNFTEIFQSKITKNLDELTIIKLSEDSNNNKALCHLLETKSSALITWKFLANSNLSKNVDIIKYFDELPIDKFSLETIEGKNLILNPIDKTPYAQIKADRIIINLPENANEINFFLNHHKLCPSTTYNINSIDYLTDKLGRIKLLKIDQIHLNKKFANELNNGWLLSKKLGGLDHKINKIPIGLNIFDNLENELISYISKRNKVTAFNIKPIYYDNSIVPNSFNVDYVVNKKRVVKNIKNGDKLENKLLIDISKNPKLKELIATDKSVRLAWEILNESAIRNNLNVIKYFSNIIDEVGEEGLKNKYIIEIVKDVLVIKSKKTGNLLAEITETTIMAKLGHGDKLLNEFLSEYKMIPNMTYSINGLQSSAEPLLNPSHKYITDRIGRVKQVSGSHSSLPQIIPLRNVEQQGLSKKIKGGIHELVDGKQLYNKAGHNVYKDHGGHIIANMFGGGTEMFNYIPMSKKLNGSGGGWNQMEQKIAKALKQGKKVDFNFELKYNQNNNSHRPDFINVVYQIEGESKITELFDNNVF